MSDRYSITRRSHDIEVEVDSSLILVTSLRLFIDGFSADGRYAVWGEIRLHGELRDGERARPVTVEVGIGLFGNTTRCVVIEDGAEYPLVELRGCISTPVSKDRELLEAIRENEDRITSVGAAIATSLSVREADKWLSELAGGGHLAVERKGGSLVYVMPGSSDEGELEGA